VLYVFFLLDFVLPDLKFLRSREEDFAVALLGLRVAQFSTVIFLGSVLLSGT
jgi:hypothetical protein